MVKTRGFFINRPPPMKSIYPRRQVGPISKGTVAINRKLALSALAKVNRLTNNIEIKRVISTYVAGGSPINPYAATPVQRAITMPAQGVEEAQRIGEQISVHSISGRFRYRTPLESDAVATLINPCQIRVMLLAVKEDYTTAASATLANEVLNAGGSQYGMYASRNPDFTDKIQVLWQKNYVLNRQSLALYDTGTSGSFTALPTELQIKMYHKFKKPLQIKFSGTNATDTENISFFMLGISEDVSGHQGVIEGRVTVRYSDL